MCLILIPIPILVVALPASVARATGPSVPLGLYRGSLRGTLRGTFPRTVAGRSRFPSWSSSRTREVGRSGLLTRRFQGKPIAGGLFPISHQQKLAVHAGVIPGFAFDGREAGELRIILGVQPHESNLAGLCLHGTGEGRCGTLRCRISGWVAEAISFSEFVLSWTVHSILD